MDAQEKNPVDAANKWLSELKLAKREDEKWAKRGKKIVKRYRDERSGWSDTAKRFNILWANVQTILPALYGKTPRAQVERRYKDQDPIGRTAAQILERALQYEIDHYGDFDAAIKSAVTDRLLPGRGVAWVRFETKEAETPEVTELEEGGENVLAPEVDEYEYECTPVDYVFWEDFRCSPARCWDEVTWVARRVYMSREDGVKRFGDDFKEVPLTHEPMGLDELQKSNGDFDTDSMKKAQIWEIWSKPDEMVYWVAEGYSKTLDIKENPYGLDNFWPCPRPLYSTQTTDTLVPVPDFAQYQDQADELDKLTNRIASLTDAVKVVGVYDASQPSIQRMLSEGVDNTLIPVDTWAAFGEKGGIKGTIDFLPLDMVIMALQQCYQAREQAKQVIYEITGLSDIIRGTSVASETATAQQIKSQYGSLRIRSTQMDVARFASEILRIKAQLMCDLYAPESLIQMSGIMGTIDAQFAEQAIQLIKSEPARNFRIEVAADSMIEMDEAAEKDSRMEFLQSVGGFLQQVLPVAQAQPKMAPLLAEMLLFAVRSFKGGRSIEAAFDSTMAELMNPQQAQAPQPDPAQQQAEMQMQVEQARLQTEQQRTQIDAQAQQMKVQSDQTIAQMKMQGDMQIEQMRQAAETERARMVAEIDAAAKIRVAEIAASQRTQSEVIKGSMDAMQTEIAVSGE